MLHCRIIRHNEIPKEAKRFLISFFKNRNELLPSGFDLSKLLAINLSEDKVFEKVHWIEASPTVINGLKNLKSIVDILS